LLNKYIKCNIWRLAVRYDIYIYIYVIRRLRVNITVFVVDKAKKIKFTITGQKTQRGSRCIALFL